MKALPKRKGNGLIAELGIIVTRRLNESPSEKEGKSGITDPGVLALFEPQ